MTAATLHPPQSDRHATGAVLLRCLALSILAVVLAFLVNNVLIFWSGWPGVVRILGHHGWLIGAAQGAKPLEGAAVVQGWLQLALYLAAIGAVVAFTLASRGRPLRADAKLLSALSAYIVRAAFWTVFFIGLADAAISFLRIEGMLESVVGEHLTVELGRSQFRGIYVHLPLLLVAAVGALFWRTLGFTWLALLVVVAELQIVLTRFIFSYEQAFMGDLVRFWYAALFLFASAYTLIEEGHVRVDVLYTGFSERRKAWVNAIGSLILGVPLCWVIIALGMWGKATVINAPILSFETSQSGFGLYVKYLMAGFLAVYALSMMIQFLGYFLSNAANLRGEPRDDPAPTGTGH